MVPCASVALERVPCQRLVCSVVRRSVWFSVMEDDEEEFPNTRTEELLHNNNGKEKRENFLTFIVSDCFSSPFSAVKQTADGSVE